MTTHFILSFLVESFSPAVLYEIVYKREKISLKVKVHSKKEINNYSVLNFFPSFDPFVFFLFLPLFFHLFFLDSSFSLLPISK